MKKIFFGALASFLFIACNDDKKEDKAATDAAATTVAAEVKKAAIELIDINDAAVVATKASMAAFEKGDIDGYAAEYDDNVMFRWSGGDSLVGKQAVKDYYTGRWKLIESIKFSNQIFLAINANESPNGGVTSPGKWVFSWYQVNAKYKNGKALQFWVHNANHINAAGKVDQAAQFIDRQPLTAATKDMVK